MKFLCLLTTLLLPFYAAAEAVEASSETTEAKTLWSPNPLIMTGLWGGGIYATTLTTCRFFAGPFAIQRQNCNNIAAVVASATIVVSSAAKQYRLSFSNDGKPIIVEVEQHEEL